MDDRQRRWHPLRRVSNKSSFSQKLRCSTSMTKHTLARLNISTSFSKYLTDELRYLLPPTTEELHVSARVRLSVCLLARLLKNA